jgi:hypothetical protein
MVQAGRRFGHIYAKDKWQYSQSESFRGILFQSCPTKTLSFSEEKLTEAETFFLEIDQMEKWSKDTVEKCNGKQQWFSNVIWPPRKYAKRWYDLLSRMNKSNSDMTPPRWAKIALKLWFWLIKAWRIRGGTAIAYCFDSMPTVQFKVDASPKWGIGIYCTSNGKWAAVKTDNALRNAAMVDTAQSSTFLEALAIPYGFIFFENEIRDRHIEIMSDSQDAILAYKKGFSESNENISKIINLISSLEVANNTYITLTKIPRCENIIADNLSKNNLLALQDLGVKPSLEKNSANTNLFQHPLISRTPWSFS